MIAEAKKNKKSGKWKRIIFSGVLVLLFIGLIVFLVFTNVKIKRKRIQQISRLEELKEEIRILEEKNNELMEDFSRAESGQYLEEVAREQLGMKAPGEEVVVVSKEEEEEVISQDENSNEQKSFWNLKTWWNWLTGK